jgi:hypothetical protein
MKIPKRLEPLLEDGVIDGVVRPLMNGREATVRGALRDEIRCAKGLQGSQSDAGARRKQPENLFRTVRQHCWRRSAPRNLVTAGTR